MILKELPSAPPPEELAAALHSRRGFFFLDSARKEEGLRSFSFIGFDPFLTWRSSADQIVVESPEATEQMHGDPLTHLRARIGRYRTPSLPGLPFCGGAVGYFGYEFGAHLEGVRRVGSDEPEQPEALFGFYDGFIAYDHALGKAYAVANPVASRSAEAILAGLTEAVNGADGYGEPDAGAPGFDLPRPNLTWESYRDRVLRIKAYIAAGDVYQVNFAQRFEAPTDEPPFSLYRRLRRLNPAAFGAYLDMGGVRILSTSPERLARIDPEGVVVTRPIKGTRPRGTTPAEDRRLASELLASEKDRAELLMIVDLERNDLGRVCRFGSVRVEQLYQLETHPTVHHLVATVSGRLSEASDRFDCLRSLMPGGSITGAPKIRAMEIIQELEPCRRGVYTGSIGYLGFDGACDLNIAIRTLVCRDGLASYHVGGGITSDSDPRSEYEETLAKGRALRAALMGGLDR